MFTSVMCMLVTLPFTVPSPLSPQPAGAGAAAGGRPGAQDKVCCSLLHGKATAWSVAHTGDSQSLLPASRTPHNSQQQPEQRDGRPRCARPQCGRSGARLTHAVAAAVHVEEVAVGFAAAGVASAIAVVCGRGALPGSERVAPIWGAARQHVAECHDDVICGAPGAWCRYRLARVRPCCRGYAVHWAADARRDREANAPPEPREADRSRPRQRQMGTGSRQNCVSYITGNYSLGLLEAEARANWQARSRCPSAAHIVQGWSAPRRAPPPGAPVPPPRRKRALLDAALSKGFLRGTKTP
jgi:hypothetical protein